MVKGGPGRRGARSISDGKGKDKVGEELGLCISCGKGKDKVGEELGLYLVVRGRNM